MAIDLTALFTPLGKLAKVHRGAAQYAGGNLAAYTADALTALAAEPDLLAPLPSALTSAQAQAVSVGGPVQAVMAATLVKHVNADTPQADRNSLPLSLAELVRQMVNNGSSVPACAITFGTVAGGGNSGTGVVVSSAKRGDGRTQQNVFAEIGDLVCTGDAQGGTSSAGSEPWLYTGDYATPNVMAHDWPGGSGARAGLTTIDSQSSGANLLSNGGMETFSVTDIPDGWSYLVGTVTTHYGKEASTVHRGTNALKLKGDGSTLHSLAHTLTNLRPNRVYAFNLWARAASALSAGNLVADLVDGSNSTVNDDQGAANGNTVALNTLSTSVWSSLRGVLITPRVLPATLKLRLRITGTAIPNTNGVIVDSAAIGEATFLYAGGPALAAFAGATPWVVGDRHTVSATNDRNGATYGSTWNCVFDRFFSTRQLGIIIPYSGSPTIADTLITS